MELSRYTEDELRRIADLKEDRLNQCEVVVTTGFTANITNPPAVYANIIPAGTTEKYSAPGMSYDSATGIFTALYDGVYKLDLDLYVEDPGGVVTNYYTATIGYTINGGVPLWAYWDMQHETLPITMSMDAGITGITAGDTIDPLYAITSATLTGTVQAYSTAHIKRLR